MDGDPQIIVPGAAFSENHVEADGFKIRYAEAGNGPTIVSIHGAGGMRLSRTHDILAENHRVVVFELPGFGASAANDRSENIQALAGTMNAALAALKIAECSVMGNSFGARVVLWMALLDATRFDCVVLVAPAAIPFQATQPPPTDERSRLYAHPEKQPPEPEVPAEVREQQQQFLKRMRDTSPPEELVNRLGEIELPVLALFGTKDRVSPTTAAHLYAESLPDCSLMLVYDAAHAIDADRPEAVSSIVADFVERKGEFLVTRETGVIDP